MRPKATVDEVVSGTMDFRIPEPCEESWASMEPRPGGRFCQRCQHVVVDLSRLTRREAEARIKSERGEYLCVQLAVDDSDAARFRSEPRRARNLAGGLVLAAALTTAGCRESDTAADEAALIESEPCAVDPGPPMMPIGTIPEPEPDAGEPAVVVPTDEQRELTRQKQEQQEQSVRPPIRRVRGRMPLRRD